MGFVDHQACVFRQSAIFHRDIGQQQGMIDDDHMRTLRQPPGLIEIAISGGAGVHVTGRVLRREVLKSGPLARGRHE